MNTPCRGNTGRLIALISGSLRTRAADRLRQHMQDCAGCREGFERLTLTKQLCQNLGRQEPPSLPWRKVEAQIYWRLAHDEEVRRRPKMALLPVGAAALGAMVALALVWWLQPDWAAHPAAPRIITRTVPGPAVERDHELAAVPTLVQGEAYVISSSGSRLPLRLDRPVIQGSRVVTATGRAALQWLKGSGLLLGADSEIELRQLMSRSQRVQLDRGTVQLKLARLPVGGSFAVEARGIRARVKGTAFRVAIALKTVDVEVHEGVVRVEPTDGSWDGVDVPRGFAVRVPFGARHAPRLVGLGGAQPLTVHTVPWPDLPRMMATTGLLTLETHPAGADLLFDSSPVGSTNLMLRGSEGRHLVELYRDGKLLARRFVDLTGGEPTSLKLRPQDVVRRLPERIHRYITQRAVQIRGCYERHLKRDPLLEGKLTFRISIDALGQVTATDLISDSFPDPRVGQCAQIVIQRWQFPPGNAVQVVYPFLFRPQ